MRASLQTLQKVRVCVSILSSLECKRACVQMSACVCVCVCVCMCVCGGGGGGGVCVCVCVCVCICVYLCVCRYVYRCRYVYVCMSVLNGSVTNPLWPIFLLAFLFGFATTQIMILRCRMQYGIADLQTTGETCS